MVFRALTRLPLFFALALSASPARAMVSESAAASMCEGKGVGYCLSWLLVHRCAVYSGYNPLSKREFRCEGSVNAFIDLMKPYQPEGETNVIAFPHRISPLFADKAAYAFLKDLPAAVEKAVEGADGQPFRLWTYALGKAGNDEMKALEWIAVLLQDSHVDANVVVEHARIDFGRKSARKLSKEQRETWEAAIEALSFDRMMDDSAESTAMYLRPYPPGIDTEYLTKGFYHFYVAAYATRALQAKRGSVTESGRDMNAFVPFLLNALYEMTFDIVDVPEDDKLAYLKDPAPFSPKEKWHSLRDIYTGYAGALFGFGGADLLAKGEAFPSLSERFAKNPRGTMKSLFWDFLPKSKKK